MSRPLRRALAAAAVLLLLLPAAAGALSVAEVSRELRCPTCNAPLDVSNSPAANEMKAFIAERIDAGWNKGRIIDAMVDEFGTQVLATPPKSGFNLLAWVVPIGAGLAGLVALPMITCAWARRRPRPAAVPELSDEDRARIDAELRRHEP